MFRLKINKKEEGVVCEELVSIKAEMARICGSYQYSARPLAYQGAPFYLAHGHLDDICSFQQILSAW
jgi:hypothetical protein